MAKKYMRNLSIIIPHYNTPELLYKLIDSIPQSPDVQIIVVDDNSNHHLQILTELQKKYCDLVQFYTNNTRRKGAGTCRNIGLQHADGKWILFADADDFFMPEMYEKVCTYFETDYDEVFFIPTSIYLDTGKIANRHLKLKKCINHFLENPTRENLLRLKITTCSPCSRLIKHDLIRQHNIQFKEILYSNDIMFTAQSGYYSKKIAADKNIIYCMTRNHGSLTTHTDWNTFLIRLYEEINVCDFLLEHYSKRELKKMQYACSIRLAEAVRHHYGFKKYLFIIKLYIQHGVPMLSREQLNLNSLINYIKSLYSNGTDSNYYVKNK